MSSKGIDFTRKRWRSKRRQGSNKTEIVFAAKHYFTFTLMAACGEDCLFIDLDETDGAFFRRGVCWHLISDVGGEF